MRETDVIPLTGDELTAIAYGLGAEAFPGARSSCFDAADPELRPMLAHGFLMSLVARGLLTPDPDGVLQPSDELAVLIGAVASHRVHLSVEQRMPATHPGSILRWEIMTAEAGTVRHLVDDPIHFFAIDPADGDPASVVADLVDRSAGPGAPGRTRRRADRSRLDEIVPAPDGGWRRVTRLTRGGTDGRARIDGFLGILDGGPGQLWLVHDDTVDETLVAVPVSADEVDAALRAAAAG
ncbi:hypothetical protein [Streptosporangium sp. NPDC002524]|uniref:hypothetical protein n=1 Tax=Streptosporangium sp. NPDC002524 TaxID=3154537 RepID=UPI0033191473